MTIIELFLIALGLSMDAFAASICKGLCVKNLSPKHYLTTGLWFGTFQGLMPLFGYFLGSTFEQYITLYDHWIAFILLCFIGINMIRESFKKEEEEICCELDAMDNNFSPSKMLPMAIATSIDALAVGVTFALLPDVHLASAALLIFGITFLLSMIGLHVGHTFGQRYKKYAEIAGGMILVAIGIKILIEHLSVRV